MKASRKWMKIVFYALRKLLKNEIIRKTKKGIIRNDEKGSVGKKE